MLQIAPLREDDLPMIRTFVAALHDFERQLIPTLSPGSEVASAGLERMLRDVSDQKGLVLVARTSDQAVGFGCVLIDDHRDPTFIEAVRRRAYISYLYVADTWRRKGIGRKLLDAMEQEARRRGCMRLVTRYKTANAVAGECYKAAGFKSFEEIVSKSLG
jgi:aminoglycoside 6'-N-acetyltransferase I